MVVAIRDTEPSKQNPYSTSERWTKIHDSLHQWGSLVRIVVIPDIDEICYGRDVGYGIRRIDLGETLHAVSGTKKRISTQLTHPIIWLTGQSGSGKTSLAAAIKDLLRTAVILDGDEMRESISDEGFSRDDRHLHNLRVARLAQVLSRQSVVIVSVIAPFAETRSRINELISPIWVLCRRSGQQEAVEFPYEVPTASTLNVVADADTRLPLENAERVVNAIQKL